MFYHPRGYLSGLYEIEFGRSFRDEKKSYCRQQGRKCLLRLLFRDGGLGFRDFELFNLAMLAKQFWRLHSREYSLIARLYKACYYLNSNMWESCDRIYPSYCWCSIWSSRKKLDMGVRWKVGDGCHIRVWKNTWLDVSGSSRIISPCP